jgi:hypothetical protein
VFEAGSEEKDINRTDVEAVVADLLNKELLEIAKPTHLGTPFCKDSTS